MKDHPANPASALPFLVSVGDSHVLVDAPNARLLVLNETGARCWRALAEGVLPRTPGERAFVGELARFGFPSDPGEPGGAVADRDAPRVIGQAALQVAANTSDPNPFSADPAW